MELIRSSVDAVATIHKFIQHQVVIIKVSIGTLYGWIKCTVGELCCGWVDCGLAVLEEALHEVILL